MEGHSTKNQHMIYVSLKMKKSMIWEEMITNNRKRVVLTSRSQLFK